jgi:hypothetical protein
MTLKELVAELRTMRGDGRNLCADVHYWLFEAADYRPEHLRESCEVSIWDDHLNNHYKAATPEAALALYREARGIDVPSATATADALGDIPVNDAYQRQ